MKSQIETLHKILLLPEIVTIRESLPPGNAGELGGRAGRARFETKKVT